VGRSNPENRKRKWPAGFTCQREKKKETGEGYGVMLNGLGIGKEMFQRRSAKRGPNQFKKEGGGGGRGDITRMKILGRTGGP